MLHLLLGKNLNFVAFTYRDNVFNIIGAFDVPRYIYSVERKKFVP